jgi:hypothetical protein
MRTLPLLTIVLATAAAGMGCQSGASSPLEVQTDPAGLTVVPSVTSIGNGTSFRLVAKVRQPDGSTTTPPDVIWLSGNGAIASVDGTGLVQGLSAGRVQIVATWHDSRGSSLVTVLEPVIKKPPPRCLEQGTAGAGSEIPQGGECA